MRNETKIGARLAAVVLVTMSLVSSKVLAQTTGGPYEPEVQGLVLEVKVNPASIRPAPDEGFLAFIAGGELRVRIDNWNFRGRNYRMSAFVVPAGAPLPSTQVPESTSAMMLVQAFVRMEAIFHVLYKDSGPGFSVAGRVSQRLGGIGDIEPGEVWMFGFSYPQEAIGASAPVPVRYKDVTFWSPSQLTLYEESAAGSMIVVRPR